MTTPEQNQTHKKSNTKIIAIIIIVVLLVAVGVYVFISQKAANNPATNQQVRGNREDMTESFRQRFRGEPATIDEIQPESQIMVIGKSNSDGSMTADIIRIGDFSGEDMAGFMNRPSTTDESGLPAGQQERFGGGNFDRSAFQNMTQEERQQRFQEMQASGNMPTPFPMDASGSGSAIRGMRTASESMQVARGRVVDINETIITLGLDEGGSRLILFSPSTEVFKQPSATSTEMNNEQ